MASAPDVTQNFATRLLTVLRLLRFDVSHMHAQLDTLGKRLLPRLSCQQHPHAFALRYSQALQLLEVA